MTTSHPNMIPMGWTFAELSDLTSKVGSGATPRGGSESYHRIGIPLIRSMNVHFFGFNRDGLVFLDENQAAQLKEATVAPDDVLLNITGASIGRVCQVPVALAGARVNQHVCIIRPRQINPAYIAMYLSSPDVQRMIWSEEYGVTRQGLTKGQILKFAIPIPPPAEQKRIVAKIEQVLARVNAARERLAKVPTLLKRFRQSVLAAACSGRLTADWRAKHPNVEDGRALLRRIKHERRRIWSAQNPRKLYVEPEPINASDLVDLPPTWCWARWEQVGFCQNGSAFPSKRYSTTGIRLLRPGNLHVNGHLNWTDDNTRFLPMNFAKEKREFVVGPHELVMNLTAQSLKDEFLGRVCLSVIGDDCLLNQRIARVKPLRLLPEFCLYLFKSTLFRRYVNELNTGSLIQHMFTSQVFDFVLPLPPIEEQREIVSRVDALFKLADAIEVRANFATKGAEKLTQAVLAKAFRGELVPTEAELAEAEGRDYETAEALLERIRRERAADLAAKPARARPRRRATKAPAKAAKALLPATNGRAPRKKRKATTRHQSNGKATTRKKAKKRKQTRR